LNAGYAGICQSVVHEATDNLSTGHNSQLVIGLAVVG